MDASGNVIGRMGHLPFGEEFAESGTQEKHHFTSYDLDESATDYGINRQYSPSVGRFQQADPYQASGYLVNPQSWNRYSYVENDPIHNIDPRGLLEGVPNIEMPDPCVGGLLTPISSIYKVYNFRLRCSPKTATQAMSDLKKIFTDLASYYEGFGGDGIDFERVPITDNARISIHLLYGDLIIPFTADVHVDVIKNDPFGWAFATESDHVFYPGKISFRMQNIPNDSGKNILFTITVIGVINGRLNEIAFDNGIDTFEDTVWHRLGDAVQARICGI
jgi:RHS repeat-associated protein